MDAIAKRPDDACTCRRLVGWLSTFLVVVMFSSTLTSAFAPLMILPPARERVGRSELRVVREICGDTELDEELVRSEDKLVVVEYRTTWSVPALVFYPKFMELSEVNDEDTRFFTVIVDDSKNASLLFQREQINTLPTYHFWQSNKKIGDFNGTDPLAIESAIEDAIQKSGQKQGSGSSQGGTCCSSC